VPHRAGAIARSRLLLRSATALAVAALGTGLLAGQPASAASHHHATKPVPLEVYSSEGYDALVVHDFEAETGIPVHLETKPLKTLTAEVQSTKSNPHWGVLWVDGPTAMATLDGEHLLVKHLKTTASLNALGLHALPKDKSFVPTGVTFTAALLYSTKAVSLPPTTFAQLLLPQWKGQIAMTTPKQVAATYPFIAGQIAQVGGTKGVAKGEAYFTALKKNGLVVYPTTGQTIQAVSSGKVKAALLQSSVAVGAEHVDPTLGVTYLHTVTVLPSTIAVDAKATKKQRAEGAKFINYVLSASGQNAMQAGTRYDESNYYPVVDNVQPLAGLPSTGAIPSKRITPYVWAKRQAAITAWFVKHITH